MEETITNAFVHFQLNRTVTDDTIPGDAWPVTALGSIDGAPYDFVTLALPDGVVYNATRTYTLLAIDGDYAGTTYHIVADPLNGTPVSEFDARLQFAVEEDVTDGVFYDNVPVNTHLTLTMLPIVGTPRTEVVDYPLAIDPQSYVKRDVVDFAPRAGSGDVAYSNLDLYQIITQDSFHHGFGFVQLRDKFGYRITDSANVWASRPPDAVSMVDTRHIGMAMLWSDSGFESVSVSVKSCVDFDGATYFNCGVDGVYKRTSSGVWSRVLNAAVADLKSNGAFLVASIVSGRMRVSSDGSTWLNAGVSANPPINYGSIETHNGFMWASEASVGTRTLTGTWQFGAGVDAGILYGDSDTLFLSELRPGDIIGIGPSWKARVIRIYDDRRLSYQSISSGDVLGYTDILLYTYGTEYNVLHFWSMADASDAEGGGLADVASIQVGSGGYAIKRLISFNGTLYAIRPDGAWAIDETVAPPVARRVLNFNDEVDSNNFNVCVVWRGRLYFNIKNMLYAYNGSSLTDVTPPSYSLDYPPAAFGSFRAATYRGPYMYVCGIANIQSDEFGTGSYYGAERAFSSVLAFDGTGWFRMTAEIGPREFDGSDGLCYSPLANRLFIGAGSATRYVPFQQWSELPYPLFETIGHHYLNLSEIDYGFRRVVKSFAEIDLEVYNVAAGRYVAVDYAADGGDWYRLGYTSQDGVTALTFNPTVEANKLDVRLDFQTSTASESPVLRNLAIKAMVRPAVLYSHRFSVIGADLIQMLDGFPHTLSSEEQHALLEEIRDSRAPVTYIDPFGLSHTAYVSTVQFTNVQRRPNERRSNWNALVNLVEVR